VRLAAWEAADRLPFPTGYERAWKYLNPGRLRIEGLQPDLGGSPSAVQPYRGCPGGAVLLTNGSVAAEHVADGASEQGVVFSSLDTAVRTHPELVRQHLGTVVPAEESVFTALNAAFWSGGVFVYVPKDTRVALPLNAILTATAQDTALFPRVLLVVERGAEVTLIQEHNGGVGATFASSVTELVLGDEAKVRHFSLQRWGTQVQELFFQRATLGRGADLLTAHAALGSQISKGWIEALIRGSGATSVMLGLIFGTGDQYVDFITLQDHIGDHTVSDLLIKSALKDRAQSAYYGLTRINREARMADANQENRNLLLSDKAKAEADPVLEILTSEVARCAHGASAGPVDPEQLFYLESRGLPRPEAEKLLIQGFLAQVLERIPLEDMRSVVEQAVAAKLRS
jgi:Fe-S cluster assembly protein SufD